ncbi:chemotaxis protein CheX [Pontibacillus salicampi]|uniref:Chemotaxis protein CheX n=1 Tax=Pontibacillus salicampi TaxID=1449801 RepID=A0ABV6LLN1_9BACI
MVGSKSVTEIVNGTIESVKAVLPFDIYIEKPNVIQEPLIQADLGVLIGMTGDMEGRLLIEGTRECISSIGSSMFGMPIGDEMLESFTGELANMIAGNLATIVSGREVHIDITPPTVIVGATKLYGFDRAFKVPVSLLQEETLYLILMIENS